MAFAAGYCYLWCWGALKRHAANSTAVLARSAADSQPHYGPGAYRHCILPESLAQRHPRALADHRQPLIPSNATPGFAVGKSFKQYPQSGLWTSLGVYLVDIVHSCVWSFWNDAVISLGAIVGKAMPGSGHNSSRKARPALLLNVAVVVWLSLAIVPCALQAATPSDTEAAQALQTQPDCHGNHIEAQSSVVDCCCHAPAVSGGEVPKTQRVDFVALTAPEPSIQPVVFTTRQEQWLRLPPVDDDGPPLYLATQRLRI